MRAKRWCQVMMVVMTVLALAMPFRVAAQTTTSEHVVTVYKTPT